MAPLLTPPRVPPPLRGFARIHGRRLETASIVPDDVRARPVHLVFLHGAFGSVSAWDRFPSEIAHAAGCPALAYSRAGHGHSDAAGRPRADYLEVEARSVLPALLDTQGIARPLLVGHEDGAAIALLYAADFDVAGVVAIAARTTIDEPAISAVQAARSRLAAGEAMASFTRHHRDPGALLARWSTLWPSPEARERTLTPALGRIKAPVLLIHGEDDEHANLADRTSLALGLLGHVRTLSLEAAGHAPWEDAPRAVTAAIVAFVDESATSQPRSLSASARS